MACFGIDETEDFEEVGSCIHCYGPVNKDEVTTEYCSYSPTQCEVCGFSPCDGSC